MLPFFLLPSLLRCPVLLRPPVTASLSLIRNMKQQTLFKHVKGCPAPAPTIKDFFTQKPKSTAAEVEEDVDAGMGEAGESARSDLWVLACSPYAFAMKLALYVNVKKRT